MFQSFAGKGLERNRGLIESRVLIKTICFFVSVLFEGFANFEGGDGWASRCSIGQQTFRGEVSKSIKRLL